MEKKNYEEVNTFQFLLHLKSHLWWMFRRCHDTYIRFKNLQKYELRMTNCWHVYLAAPHLFSSFFFFFISILFYFLFFILLFLFFSLLVSFAFKFVGVATAKKCCYEKEKLIFIPTLSFLSVQVENKIIFISHTIPFTKLPKIFSFL